MQPIVVRVDVPLARDCAQSSAAPRIERGQHDALPEELHRLKGVRRQDGNRFGMASVKFFLGDTGGGSPDGVTCVIRRKGIRVNRVNGRREVDRTGCDKSSLLSSVNRWGRSRTQL